MGILNITPDSFSDGGDNFEMSNVIANVEDMVTNSVDIIDIGGESTRPSAQAVDIKEEINRVIPIIKILKKIYPKIQLSIDTTKYDVAKMALDNGVDIINDVSGLQFEPKFAELAAQYNAGLVIMHMQGNPKIMQSKPYYFDVVEEVYYFLNEKVELAKSFGVKKIWSDVGIGFGKTFEHNIQLLKNLDKFNKIGVPQLLGISRKSFLKNILEIDNPKERDLGTVLLHTLLLTKGIDILRVHNVQNLNTLRKLIREII